VDLSEYQVAARQTDQMQPNDERAVVVPLLGIASEAASLLSEYKKWLRDGPSYRLYKEQFAEELGDVLWYLANLADRFGLDLNEVASANLVKTQLRFGVGGGPGATTPLLFDSDYQRDEQFPRKFVADLGPAIGDDGVERSALTINGKVIGDALRDNSYEDDGFRYHDVLHLSHMAMLGWSPAFRRLMKCKRKSNPIVDEVEDGARARVIDEGIVAFVFDYARRHNWLEGLDSVDYELLRSLKNVTAGLEVSVRSPWEWEQAILAGYRVWRVIRRTGEGRIAVDLEARTMELL
jgi:NTP pyrophosphatase (non-canonical NTP hydrolase)